MSDRICRISIVTAAIFGTALAIGCGSDDDKDSGAQARSFADVSAEIQQPTGTVDATTAGPVAQEFGTMSTASLAGSRDYASTQTAEEACDAGGTVTASGTGNDSSGNVSMRYNDCCYTADCCYNGTGNMIYSDANGSDFSVCFDYDVAATCEGQSLTVDYAACMQSDGSLAYSIEVAGETFTVSGYYSDGNGQLTIRGANGTWDCTYTNDSGTCTGTGGEFSF